MNNIERIKNRLNEYYKHTSFRYITQSNDSMAETDDAIQLYVRSLGVSVDLVLYAMIDLDINKRLTVYEKVLDMAYNYEGLTVEFNGSHYDFRYADYRDSIILGVYFFRALYFANLLNRPELYRKILEIGGKDHFYHVKMLLDTGGSYINSVGCRTQLIDYINKHNNEEDIGL